MTLLLKIKEQPFVLLFFICCLFIGTNIVFQNIIYGNKNFNLLLLSSLQHTNSLNYIFWSSSIGIGVKSFIDIVITALLLKAFMVFFKYQVLLKEIISLVCIAYVIFYLQMILEFVYIIVFDIKHNKLEYFSLFSIAYFLNYIPLTYPFYYEYIFDTVNLFEFIFMGTLVFYIKKNLKINFVNALKLIIVSYFLPLLIWLLLITYISLLNS